MAVLPRFALPIARFALPIARFATAVKRIHLPQPVMLLSLKQFSHRRYVLLPENGRWNFVRIRSMATGEESEAVVSSSVPVLVAHELLQSGHRYLDVRTVDEFNAGHVVGATNIPFMLNAESGMTKNLHFLDEVSKSFEKDDEILIGCLSGRRSFLAASELSSAGFTSLTNVAGGYASWLQNNLPIEL